MCPQPLYFANILQLSIYTLKVFVKKSLRANLKKICNKNSSKKVSKTDSFFEDLWHILQDLEFTYAKSSPTGSLYACKAKISMHAWTIQSNIKTIQVLESKCNVKTILRY